MKSFFEKLNILKNGFMFSVFLLGCHEVVFAAGQEMSAGGGLNGMSIIYGILAGICVWFIDYDRTLFVSIQELNRLRFELNKKSLNIKDVYENTLDKQMYLDIEGKKAKTYFNYDTSYFINSLETLVAHIWTDNKDSDING